MTLATLAVAVFEGATPIQIGLTVTISAIFLWVLWVGARSNKPRPPADDVRAERDAESA
jgi:hypothetical protein